MRLQREFVRAAVGVAGCATHEEVAGRVREAFPPAGGAESGERRPVRLENPHLTAFGKFRGRELELGPGLNLIFGSNEAGKSTVQHFIYGMLYGFLKAGARRRIRMEDMDRFAPWQNGGGYRGSLVYRLEHTGRRLRVNREFGARLEGLLPELTAEVERAGASFRQAAEAQAEAARALAPLAPLAELPPDAGALAVQLLERWNGAHGEWARRRSNLGSRRAQVARGAAELAARRALGEPAEVEARLERLIAACAAAGVAEPAVWAARLEAARRRGRNRAAMAAPLLGLAAAAGAAAVGLGPARPWLGYGLLAASAGLAAGAAVCAGARRLVRRLDADLEQVRAHVDDWARLSSGLGAAGAGGLRAAVRDWLRQADRLAHDAEQLGALEHELDQLHEQVQETARGLELLLRPVTSLLSGAGAGLEQRVTALTELLHRYRELTEVCGQRRQQGAAAAARLEAAQARLQEAQVRMDDLLGATGVADLGGRVAADRLSAGTCDRLYMALRIALVELLVPPDRERPLLILDDPFTQADGCRLTGSMALVAELARDYQVLYFTCHRRELEAARAAAGQLNLIELA